jgi:hypothetical protein
MEASSAIEEMKTGYALKKGERLGGRNAPDGSYDGAFAEDYEYVGGVRTFDECNGRFCVTPEFPSGTYAYFMTQDLPVIPRASRGTPEQFKTLRVGEGPGVPDRRGGLPRGGPPPRQ